MPLVVTLVNFYNKFSKFGINFFKKIMKTRKREYQKIVSTTNNVQRPQQASTNNNDVKLRQSIYSVQKVVMCSNNKTFTQLLVMTNNQMFI